MFPISSESNQPAQRIANLPEQFTNPIGKIYSDNLRVHAEGKPSFFPSFPQVAVPRPRFSIDEDEFLLRGLLFDGLVFWCHCFHVHTFYSFKTLSKSSIICSTSCFIRKSSSYAQADIGWK